MNVFKKTVGRAVLLLVDGLSPEDSAMLQALYSRSAASVEAHLQKLDSSYNLAAFADGHYSSSAQASRRGGEFMKSYYVGYNHKSIGDCGSTTFFIRNVSMLCAKAIEDSPLYCGQETSTRYIDMSAQPLVDPVESAETRSIHAAWMAFYSENEDRVVGQVLRQYPIRPGEDEKTYQKAVKARAFDILRGFLPAGICTQLSWHTNLRQANDHLAGLLLHPLAEVRNVAVGLSALFEQAYPSSAAVGSAAVSGTHYDDDDDDARNWALKAARARHYYPSNFTSGRFNSSIRGWGLADYRELLRTRPRGAVLPHHLGELGQLEFQFELDFGSFRDIQRHRNGVCRMPRLTTDYGFEQWYIDQLDGALKHEARELIASLAIRIESIADPVDRQYYIPMGFRVPCSVTYGLPAAVYVVELRTSKTVHPTLRKVAQWMASCISTNYPEVALHCDLAPDDWTVRRGAQDITAKEAP